MQDLKIGLQFNVSEGSVCSINPIPTDVFDTVIADRRWEQNYPHHFSWIEKCYLVYFKLSIHF